MKFYHDPQRESGKDSYDERIVFIGAWIVPIPGTTQMAHMVENSGAAGVRFTPAELTELNSAVKAIEIKGQRLPRRSAGLLRCGGATKEIGDQIMKSIKFIEAYAMALKQPKSFSEFLRTSVNDWLDFIAKPLIRQGRSPRESRAYATVVLAGFRGFMLDYCATRDRRRLDEAIRIWVKALENISSVKEVSDGK